jgi:hypothetical protein
MMLVDRQNGYKQEGLRRAGIGIVSGLFAKFARLVAYWQHWKRACTLVLIGMLFICITLCVAAIFMVGRASAQETQALPLDALLLIDHSNSMWDKGGLGSDPDLLRVRAARMFIAYLGVDAALTGNRLGVIHFGGESVRVVPLTPLESAEQRRAIQAAIANPARMGWTDPLGALRLVYETLFPQDRRDPARQPVVILLSDGKPELGAISSAEARAAYVAELRAVVERFREQACPIFTIALSSEATDADPEIQTIYRNLWQEIAARTPPAEYHEARTADDLLPVYHAIVARLAGAEANAPVIETLVDGEATEIVTVEDGLAQATFVVLHGDLALDVRLLRPGGAPARPTDPDVRHTGETEDGLGIWAITDPRPGRWTLAFRGRGAVLAWQDAIPRTDNHPSAYIVEAALPTYAPAGRPLSGEISVRESVTRDIVIDPGLCLVAEARRAGFAEATSLAHDDGQNCDARASDGRYCITLPDPPPGACTMLLRALLNGEEIARREVAFEMIPLPRLEVVSPRPGLPLEPAASVDLEVRVLTGHRLLDAEALAAQGTLTASLHLSNTDAISVPLKEADKSFVGRAFVPDSPGPFTLTVRLHGQTIEGLPFEDMARVALKVASLAIPVPETHFPPDAERNSPGWMLPVMGGLAGAVILGGIGGVLIRRRRPRVTLDGSLRVLAAPSSHPVGTVIDLPAAPSVVLGGADKGAVPLPGASSRVTLHAGHAPEGDVESWVASPSGEATETITLNGRSLEAARRLCDGDVLTLGDYRLRYENLRQAGARHARRRPRRREKWIGGAR